MDRALVRLRNLGIASALLAALGQAPANATEVRVITSPDEQCMRWLSEGHTFLRVSNFPEYALRLVREIQGRCIDQIGDLNLTKLANEISEVQGYIFTVGFFAAGPEMNRTSGSCDLEAKRTLMSCYAWYNSSPEARELFALHEALCAAGYVDDDLGLSMAVWRMARHGRMSADDRKSPLKNIKRRKETPRYQVAGGGTTSVGGGGLINAGDIKMGVVNKLADLYKRSSFEAVDPRFDPWIDQIIEAQLEVDNSSTQINSVVTGRTADGRLRFVFSRPFADDSSAIIDAIVKYLMETPADRGKGQAK